MTPTQLKEFFTSRPALSQKKVAEEAGISRRMLYFIYEGERGLTDELWGKLKPILERYGLK